MFQSPLTSLKKPLLVVSHDRVRFQPARSPTLIRAYALVSLSSTRIALAVRPLSHGVGCVLLQRGPS